VALDKKQIALTVVGIVAGLALTYLLWIRSQQDSANAAAQAAATAAANAEEQEQESQQFDATSTDLSDAGSGSGVIYEQSSPTTTGVTSTSDDGTSDITSLVGSLLDSAGSTSSSVPANQLIPEINVSDGTSSLSGIDTSAAQILGSAPPSTVSTTTSTGQTYGATSSPVAGTTMPGDSPVGGGGNPTSFDLDGSSPVAQPVQSVSYGSPAKSPLLVAQ
jgi:type II secretory pathway pseudopilin PulG